MHNTVVHWIRSQANPKEPEGTFINVSSGLAGFKIPGGSSYGSSKLAGHRYTEYVGLGKSNNLNQKLQRLPSPQIVNQPTNKPFSRCSNRLPEDQSFHHHPGYCNDRRVGRLAETIRQRSRRDDWRIGPVSLISSSRLLEGLSRQCQLGP